MAGFDRMPRSELIKLANANRVKAMGIAFDRPEIGMVLKVVYQDERSGTFRIPATHAVMYAEHIDPIAKARNWRPGPPTPVTIEEEDWSRDDPPTRVTVNGGHVLILQDAVILVLGFGKRLALCLRVGGNHAAWFADQVLHARDQGLLRDIRNEVPPGGRAS